MRLRYPTLELDLDTRRFVASGREGSLTEREAALLRYLAQRLGEAVRRDRLEREVFGFRAGTRSEAVPVAIRRLRAKIEPSPDAPTLLLTVQGVGWRLVRPALSPPPLPGFATPYLRRSEHEAAVLARFAAGYRLVTLCGPSGVGKTRLAVQLASELGPALFVRAGDKPPHLPEETRLLLWDGAQDHLESLRAELGEVLARPGVVVLATSRCPLQLPGEVVHPVGVMEEDEALALFRSRVEASGAPPMSAERALAAVRAVGCLPLGIELWAATLPYVPEDAPMAQAPAPLEAAMCWSWERLSERERESLVGCTVFPASFELAAARVVLGAPALEAVEGLHRRALLARTAGRFHVPDMVRLFLGALRPAPEVIAAHAAWTAQQAHMLCGWMHTRPAEACARAELLRPDLEVTLARGAPADVAAVALLMARWAHFDNGPLEVAAVLERALALGPPPELEARLRLCRGALEARDGRVWLPEPLPGAELEAERQMLWARAALSRGDLEQARQIFEEHLARLDNFGPELQFRVWNLGAVIATFSGDRAGTERYLAEAVAILRQHGLQGLLAGALAHRGSTLGSMGDERARAVLEEAVELGTANRRSVSAALALQGLHNLYLLDDPSRAASYLAQAAALPLRDITATTIRLSLALSRWLAGDLEGAERAMGGVEHQLGQLPGPWAEEGRLTVATLCAATGRTERARQLFAQIDRPLLARAFSRAVPGELDLLCELMQAELDRRAALRGDSDALLRARATLTRARVWLQRHVPGTLLLRALVRRWSADIEAWWVAESA
jgi:tetratricopeptide (TPR) repeat protein